jgi:CheY-like chemotaxis protein
MPADLTRTERRILPRPLRVLVVDDDGDVRRLWREWFTLWGFLVEEAANGQEAVEKAHARPPALVLMDWTMPVLGGLAATRKLKADLRTAAVPVVALSADVMSTSPEDAVASGCEAFLSKPVRPYELLSAIRGILRAVKAR